MNRPSWTGIGQSTAIALGLAVAIFWVSCSQSGIRAEVGAKLATLKDSPVAMVDTEGTGLQGGQAAGRVESNVDQSKQIRAEVQSRKRIVTGQLELQVSDLTVAMGLLTKANDSLGGYTAANSINGNYASLSLRVPAEKYAALLGQASGLGKLVSSETRTDDVTDSWYDLDTRLRAKRILLERYLSYLHQAKSVEDLMSIERQVSETTTELEQLEGSFRNLDNQVAYSTLNVSLHLPGSPDSSGFDFGNAFAKFWQDLGAFFQNLLIWVLYFIFFGVPLALIAALLYWVLFGRIGWLRKLFSILGKKRKTS